jgi:heme-degrading monooxygenase HmoA
VSDASPPYFAVIFSSTRDARPGDGYAEAAERMEELARHQPGFLGVESARDSALGITVSYWASREAVAAWGAHAEHLLAQKFGRDTWYTSFTLRVCVVEGVRSFTRPDGAAT